MHGVEVLVAAKAEDGEEGGGDGEGVDFNLGSGARAAEGGSEDDIEFGSHRGPFIALEGVVGGEKGSLGDERLGWGRRIRVGIEMKVRDPNADYFSRRTSVIRFHN